MQRCRPSTPGTRSCRWGRNRSRRPRTLERHRFELHPQIQSNRIIPVRSIQHEQQSAQGGRSPGEDVSRATERQVDSQHRTAPHRKDRRCHAAKYVLDTGEPSLKYAGDTKQNSPPVDNICHCCSMQLAAAAGTATETEEETILHVCTPVSRVRRGQTHVVP